MRRYLNNLKVLDISQGVAGPFCAKLLGDLGADVVKVEPPTGDVSRQYGPFPNGEADPEKSASFFFFNTSKRGIVLDLESSRSKNVLARLVADYDIVVAGESEEVLSRRGLAYADFRRWNPKIILTTVSGFGSFGPHSGYQGSHLVACAMGGWALLCGLPHREPLQAGGATTETLTGAFAAVATSLAVSGRDAHGGGEHVDVSVQEAVLAAASFPTMIYEYHGRARDRYSSVGGGAAACYVVPTREGYIGLGALTRAQWHMLCAFLLTTDQWGWYARPDAHGLLSYNRSFTNAKICPNCLAQNTCYSANIYIYRRRATRNNQAGCHQPDASRTSS